VKSGWQSPLYKGDWSPGISPPPQRIDADSAAIEYPSTGRE
jgi:hypothetical protein